DQARGRDAAAPRARARARLGFQRLLRRRQPAQLVLSPAQPELRSHDPAARDAPHHRVRSARRARLRRVSDDGQLDLVAPPVQRRRRAAGGLLQQQPLQLHPLRQLRALDDAAVRVGQPEPRPRSERGRRAHQPVAGRRTFLVGYVFGIDYWEPLQLQDYNLQYHRFDLRASWRFLPKTAVYIAATEFINQYPDPGAGMHPNSYPLHVDAGLQGLITTKLTLNAWIGYGNGFYVSGPSPNTAVGGLAASWKPTILSTGAIGYQHDFQNSVLGSYYDEDTAYLSWTQLVWRFTGFLRFQYSNLRYNGVQMIQATTDGTDNVIMLNVRVDYPFKDWLFVSAGYDLTLNRSNRTIALGAGGVTPGLVPVDYTKHVVYLRLTASY